MKISTADRQVSSDLDNRDSETEEALVQLRQLLLAPEQEKLEALGERLDDPVLHAQDISEVLPEAILLSASRDEKFANALAPAVAGSIMVSIKRDISTFADVLFPVIGPAIRRSIAETFKQMMQSFNQTLENSFSWRGLKWRFEAWRTGKPFAEVVLLNSLAFRVEQVFLIHRESGILLQHVVAGTEDVQDGDLVSGMLTAIQDFVRDSFEVTADETLHSIDMGDFTVWVEQGPEAVVALAIRGTPPEHLRQFLHQALEDIHLKHGDVLKEFEGEVAPFESTRHHLESCLQTGYQEKEKKKKFSPVMGLLLAAVVAVLGLWAFWMIRDHNRWSDYLHQLKSEPGIVVTEAFKEDGVYQIIGLRDPLSIEPSAILANTRIDPDQVVHRFQPYQALSSGLILKRAHRMLIPPETLDMSFEDGLLKLQGSAPYTWVQATREFGRAVPGVLQIDVADLEIMVDLTSLNAPDSVNLALNDGILNAYGSAPYRWIKAARGNATAIPGVTRYDDDGLQIEPDLTALSGPATVTLSVNNGTVTATGSAPHKWVVAAREQASSIPGVAKYDDSNLRDSDLETLMSLKEKLEQELILFGLNVSSYDEQRIEFERILSTISQLIELAEFIGGRAAVQVVGHSDSSGNYQRNLALSQGRADIVRDYLIANGIYPEYLSAVGVGANEPVTEERSEDDLQMNRSVTFRIQLTNISSEL